jgi:hypothetical protein
MKKLREFENAEAGRTFLICGAGSTLSEFREEILTFVEKEKPVIIGINNMTGLLVPTYHVWTNTGRFREFGHTISSQSTPIFRCSKMAKVIKERWKDDYVCVDYVDEEGEVIKYKNGMIRGYYRTAGCLAIMIAHIMGAKRIHIVGMDGYTYQSKEDIDNGKIGQHFYGTGMTDNYDWEGCLHKDNLVKNVLRSIKDYGGNFSIITPTIFKDFYDGAIL